MTNRREQVVAFIGSPGQERYEGRVDPGRGNLLDAGKVEEDNGAGGGFGQDFAEPGIVPLAGQLAGQAGAELLSHRDYHGDPHES